MIKKYLKIKAIKYTLLFGVFIIGYHFIQWELVDFFTPLLAPFIGLFIKFVFILIYIYSIIYILINPNKKQLQTYIPLILNTLVAIFITIFPFNYLTFKIDYIRNRDDRVKAVSLIQSGKLLPRHDNKNFIDLPKEYKHTSKGGGNVKIAPEKKFILFYTFSGMLDNYSGFVYSEDDTPPGAAISTQMHYVQKIEPHWYWIESY